MSNIRHIFKYTKAGDYKRPIIPISIKHKGKVIKYLALIDSGADSNIFHIDIARLLEIDLRVLNKIQFAGIKKDRLCNGYITVLELGIDDEFYDCPIMFSSDISNSGYGVLGQRGFFDHFKLSLDYKTDNIQLKQSKR
mgnify:CR=1 FL=1